MQINDSRLLNCKTAAIYLGMTEAALRKNIYLRRFKESMLKIGGRIYFDKKKLDVQIEQFSLEDKNLKGLNG